MKKLILVLLSVSILQGCIYQKASKVDIQKAIKFCGSVDKIWDITINFVGNEYITCTDYAIIGTDSVD